MARLPDEVVNRIKAEVSLVRLIESQGHALKRQGKDYVMCCPFHADDTPSLVVSPDSNLWHCMGACQMGGSVIRAIGIGLIRIAMTRSSRRCKQP